MQRQLEVLEEELRGRLLRMGALSEEMIHLSTRALMERDLEGLSRVDEAEEEVNGLHVEIDDRVLKLIALHQPAASDLRFLLAAVKINSELERVADQAVNIAQTTRVLLAQPRLEAKVLDIPRMAELAKGMVKDSLDAFVRRDAALAREVIRRDDEEDALKSHAFHDLMQIMQADSSTIQRALGLILISRNLERIADHATNVAEDVVFMVLGKDIRHKAPA